MKKFSRLLAILLVVAMVASFTSALALDRWQYKKYKQYMCIGDSIAAGYTVSGTWANWGDVRVPGAYHDIVARAVDAELLQYGISAFRAIELRYILDGEYTDPDGYWQHIFGAYFLDQDALDARRPKYIEGFKTSDLVTINLGSNDILTPAINKFMGVINGTDKDGDGITDEDTSGGYTSGQLAALQKWLEKLSASNPTFAQLLTLAQTAGTIPSALRMLITTLWEYYQNFKDNWEASMKAIYELNPDITLVAVGVFNPGHHIYLDANHTIDVSAIVQPMINIINNFIQNQSAYADRYYFADVDGIETWDISLSDDNFGGYFTWAVHPNRVGHVQMAARILEVIPDHVYDLYFSQQPQDVTVAEGETAEFTVAVKPDNAPTYQWQTAPAGSDDWTNVGTAVYTPTLTITADKSLDGQQYRCVAMDFYGRRGEPVTSDVAILTVTAAADPGNTDPDPADDSGKTDPADDSGKTDPADDSGKTDPADDSGKTDPADDSGKTDPGQKDDAGDQDVTPVEKKFPFLDVPTNAWYYPDVYYVWDNGIMNGMTTTSFDPQGSTTRAQFATVIYRMADSPDVSAEDVAACPFVDLTADWYKDAVVWAYKEGVVLGTSATTFTPNANITREQMVAMLWRYDGETASSTDLSRFSDNAAISAYARPAVAWSVENGIIQGMGNGTFQPQGTATRAQLAAILHRYDTK